MANYAPLLLTLSITFFIFSCSVVEGDQTWCTANPSTSYEVLQQNINFACNYVDCAPIRTGGACFVPDDIKVHASYVMNSYYATHGRTPDSCSFKNTGLVTSQDPSFGDCHFL